MSSMIVPRLKAVFYVLVISVLFLAGYYKVVDDVETVIFSSEEKEVFDRIGEIVMNKPKDLGMHMSVLHLFIVNSRMLIRL